MIKTRFSLLLLSFFILFIISCTPIINNLNIKVTDNNKFDYKKAYQDFRLNKIDKNYNLQT